MITPFAATVETITSETESGGKENVKAVLIPLPAARIKLCNEDIVIAASGKERFRGGF